MQIKKTPINHPEYGQWYLIGKRRGKYICEFLVADPRYKWNMLLKKVEILQTDNVKFTIRWFFADTEIHQKTGTKYDENWYDLGGYNKNWFKIDGTHKNGTRYDKEWYDFNGYNILWFKSNGTNKNGTKWDDNGYNILWFDKKWFSKNKIHQNGTKYDENWYDFDGYDPQWYADNGLNRNLFNQKWEYKNIEWVFFDEEGYGYNGYDKNSFNRSGEHISWIHFDEYLVKKLSEKDYEGSIRLYNDRIEYQNFLQPDEFQTLIRNQIEKYIEQHASFYTPHKPNDEQKNIIADMSQYLLVQARAWCGKTTTLSYKTHFLIKELGIRADEIIFLAFNRRAAAEINKKFTDSKMPDFQNAMTFHSLAGRLLSKSKKSSEDFEEDRDYKKDQALPDCITSILKNPIQREKVYEIFRKEIDLFEEKTLGISQEQYFEMRDGKNVRWLQKFCTLDGKTLKSIWEKWVSDFLFEHNLDYKYEWNLLWPNENDLWYQPDFCLFNFQIQANVLAKNNKNPQPEKTWIEFFGIDEFDTTKTTPPWWSKSFHEYVEEMKWKRNEFKNRSDHILIEMNERDRRSGRDIFEALLKSKLESIGIICRKWDEKELLDKVLNLNKNKTRLEQRVESFIRKCMQRSWSPEDITKIFIANSFGSPLSTFYAFAIDCYREYLKIMKTKWKQDFEMILADAINYLHEVGWDIDFRIHKERDQKMLRGHIQKLKYIIIDEYQDTSQLFFELVQTIRKYNPDIKIICVGDNWQLINSFAGSEMRFFKNFSEYYPWAKQLSLRTTYRCTPTIVEAANVLMERPWELISWVEWKSWFVRLIKLEDFYKENPEDQKYWNALIKTVLEKIIKPKYQTKDKNESPQFRILSRINHDLDNFNSSGKDIDIKKIMYSLKERTENFYNYSKKVDQWLALETAHSAKGLEADYVLLLNVGDSFPMIHPDNIYGIIFWETLSDILEEERRLFYVAITRAKYGLYYTLWKKTHSSEEVNPVLTFIDVFASKLPGAQEGIKKQMISIEDIPF